MARRSTTSLLMALGLALLPACEDDGGPAFTPVPTTTGDPGVGPGLGYGSRLDSGADAGDRDLAVGRDDAGDRDRGLRDAGGELRDVNTDLPDINTDLPDIADLPDVDTTLPDVGGMTRVDAGPAEPDLCTNDGDCTLAVQLDDCDPCPLAVPLDALAADRCLVRYLPGATLGAYAPADCWAPCGPAAGDACLDAPAAATCDPPRGPGRRCVVFR